MRVGAATLLLVTAAVAAAGCGTATSEPGTGSSEPVTTDEQQPAIETVVSESKVPEGWAVCRNEIEGFRIAYPGEWHTAHLTPAQQCSFFDPEPFDIVAGGEFPLTGIEAHPIDRSFAQAVGDMTDPVFEQVLSVEDVEVLGFPAVRIQSIATGAGLLDKGTRTYAYVIHRNGEPFIVKTFVYDVATESNYASVTATLDQALTTLRFFQAEQPREDELPASVVAKRDAIADAATAGNEEALLGLMAPNFSYSFGGEFEGGPLAYYREEAKNTGTDPIALLPSLLSQGHVKERDVYIWPAGYEATLGWRVGIREDGAWIFYIAGD